MPSLSCAEFTMCRVVPKSCIIRMIIFMYLHKVLSKLRVRVFSFFGNRKNNFTKFQHVPKKSQYEHVSYHPHINIIFI